MLRKILLLLGLYNFLRLKILPDDEINNLLPKEGKIIDLGCGDGFLASYLSRVKTREVVGVDVDKERLPQSSVNNLKFVYADLRKYKLPSMSGVVISDVLHHLPYLEQKKLLKKISNNLTKDGVLMIKEIDREEYFRSKLSRLWDFIFYPKDKIYFWKSTDLKSALEKFNFKVRMIRTSRLSPTSTNLFICTK